MNNNISSKTVSKSLLSRCSSEQLQLTKTANYYEILSQLGIVYQLKIPWLVVGEPKQSQGWKIHISSIPVEAFDLLSVVLPFLNQHQVTFKLTFDEIALCQLNEGYFGATQIGKFITIYPKSDQDAQYIAKNLINITKGFSGPVIVTDLRLGDVIYTRYGGFNSLKTQDRLGVSSPGISAPDGSFIQDVYQVPFIPPQGIYNPFAKFLNQASAVAETAASQVANQSTSLFGNGYLFLEVIKQHPKGSIFRVLDLRSQDKVSIKILKQGKQYCLSDANGRDIRTRLKHQEFLHNLLAELVPVPQADPYFEVNQDGYLPIEFLEGQSLETLATGSVNNLTIDEQVKRLSYLEKLIAAVKKLHAAGYIHRDLTSSNIWITPDEEVYLLDLELAHAVDDPNPPFSLGTHGFMSPQQEAGEQPTFADDIYALGCILILVLTGLPSYLTLFASEQDRVSQWGELVKGLPVELIKIIAQCVNKNPQERPNLAEISKILQQSQNLLLSSNLPNQDVQIAHAQLPNLIAKAQQGLLDDVISHSGLWLSSAVNNISHQDLNTARSYEVRRSANTGVAGVIYLLSRLARFGYATSSVRDRIQQVTQWLLTDETTSDKQLPGLHFGEAGVAVALVEAICSGLIERNQQIDIYLLSALSGQLDWSDVTHGAAGQGIAALYCGDRLQDPTFSNLAHRCAQYLINTQKIDGSWEMPPGVENMSGQTLTGFAHGVSGMVYFLAEYAQRFNSPEAEKAWQAGVDWLFEQAMITEDEQGLVWYFSDSHQTCWKWWCHGSPGIALTFLRLYEQTGNQTYAEIATHALQVHPLDLKYRNLSQCHGLSGLGEIYLEAARVLGDPQWLERANAIAHTLINLRRESDQGSVTWLVENPYLPTADLMVGAGGIVHFLLRLSLQGEKIGFPLLLDPVI